MLTRRELSRLRLACRVAGEAFRTGAASIVPGSAEREVAAAFRAPLEAYADREGDALVRAGGFTWCMSGPDAALGYRSYARTRNRRILFGDLVMVHCNSFVDGLWTDITRTYHPGPVDDGVRDLFEAVLAARVALAAIAPGARAAAVDRAAREVLADRGLGDELPAMVPGTASACSHHDALAANSPGVRGRAPGRHGVQPGAGDLPGRLGRPAPLRPRGGDRGGRGAAHPVSDGARSAGATALGDAHRLVTSVALTCGAALSGRTSGEPPGRPPAAFPTTAK